jgi:8-oxo-dGTP pyrophosphatase MutT (NUDIX family)
LDGLREVEEELGLQVEPERLVPLGTRRVEQEIPGGCDREFHDVFLLFDATPPGDLCLQREEVESVFRLDLDEVEALYETGWAPAREYAEGRASATRIHLAEFVPKEEGYLRRVTEAARRLLSGAPPAPSF